MKFLIEAQDRSWGYGDIDTLVSVRPPLDEETVKKALDLLNEQERIGAAKMFATRVQMDDSEPCTGIRVSQFTDSESGVNRKVAIEITGIIGAAILRSGDHEINQRVLGPVTLSESHYF